ncbi:hypothetical protein K0O13_08195 [Mammaliicoccus sciuri]|uniref:hypothetical protein n=1 Tax=Mammaliicoccus sciuri TaxID=1296 RepID=UPI001C62A9C6|nr:hypothetical protein [Mammaliicoccus sciuri]QYG30081.1 hypothetical protein K0O13_08195 [Mammaliicoccus sciuri]
MGYKYEEEIENHIICAPVHVDDEVFNELKEVYAKAKAFDEIKKLRNSYYTYSKRDSGGLIALLDVKTFGREVSHLINKKGYVEDK